MDSVQATIAAISSVDQSLLDKGRAHMDNLTKPRGSLGYLEDLACRLYAVSGGQKGRLSVDPARIYTCAGDHGVAASGVSLFPQEVTRQMVFNFLNRGAAINVLTECCNVQLKVVDAGCAGDPFPAHDLLIDARVRSGTDDISKGPAMDTETCIRAVNKGIWLAQTAAEEGCRCLGTGEMGIANTTPSTALFCAFFGFNPAEITGPGTGLDEKGMQDKAKVIEKALAANKEDVRSGDPLRIMAAVGGLEIACLTGLILGGAARGIPVIIDGFISTAAFASAWMLSPRVFDYCFFAHASAEPGYLKVIEKIGARPVLDLDMRLGEGTGAAMGVHILRCAAAIFNDMATFDQAGVSN
ncbi:MAG: nicotinate-nucleotide--dimethylbenzimidazole phosphoribosyltransferase [Thermodesulfobacteriota bacterium]